MQGTSARGIRLNRVSMSHTVGAQRVDVLKGVDLAIAPGEAVALVGPSGSGKSTLLTLLAGLEAPTAGAVEVDGTDLATLSADARADWRRDRVGIVFQSFHLLAGLSALDNVALPLRMAGARDAADRAREMLARVGLADRVDHRPLALSGGEQQRVAIARALVHRPSLLLADEPTGNLDEATGQRVRELLFDLHRASAATLVLVTHDPAFADRCDRVLRLTDGRLHERPAAARPATLPPPGPDRADVQPA
jgi:putative ABC transport system ATP-binding protein